MNKETIDMTVEALREVGARWTRGGGLDSDMPPGTEEVTEMLQELRLAATKTYAESGRIRVVKFGNAHKVYVYVGTL